METDNQQNKQNVDTSSEEDDEPENLSYKIIVLGNPTVGKTQII